MRITTTYNPNGNTATGTKRGTTIWKSGEPKSATVRVNGSVVTIGGKRVN